MSALPPYGPGFIGLPATATEAEIMAYARSRTSQDTEDGRLISLLVQRIERSSLPPGFRMTSHIKA